MTQETIPRQVEEDAAEINAALRSAPEGEAPAGEAPTPAPEHADDVAAAPVAAEEPPRKGGLMGAWKRGKEKGQQQNRAEAEKQAAEAQLSPDNRSSLRRTKDNFVAGMVEESKGYLASQGQDGSNAPGGQETPGSVIGSAAKAAWQEGKVRAKDYKTQKAAEKAALTDVGHQVVTGDENAEPPQGWLRRKLARMAGRTAVAASGAIEADEPTRHNN